MDTAQLHTTLLGAEPVADLTILSLFHLSKNPTQFVPNSFKTSILCPKAIGASQLRMQEKQMPEAPPTVTKSKLVLLATRQTNKSRGEVLGQGIVTLFGKPADQEDGGLVSQRTIFRELEFRLLLY